MPKRTDNNQAAIVAALRAVGCSVECLHAVGHGVPDLLCGVPSTGMNLLLEVKMPTGKLTPDQRAWHGAWRGQVAVVHCIEDALRVVQGG